MQINLFQSVDHCVILQIYWDSLIRIFIDSSVVYHISAKIPALLLAFYLGNSHSTGLSSSSSTWSTYKKEISSKVNTTRASLVKWLRHQIRNWETVSPVLGIKTIVWPLANQFLLALGRLTNHFWKFMPRKLQGFYCPISSVLYCTVYFSIFDLGINYYLPFASLAC